MFPLMIFRSLFPLLPFLKLNSKNHEIPKMGTIYMFCFIIITKRINFVNILMIFFFQNRQRITFKIIYKCKLVSNRKYPEL